MRPKLAELLEMTEEFREKFRECPVKRAKWRGSMRNVAAGLSSSVDPDAEEALVEALHHPEEMVREQAAMSLQAIRARRSNPDY
jgi:epoxyqueuosine reductase